MPSKTALPDIVIRASAGSGKTYQLANRYVTLLALDVSPETILAATFTRKAAGEILVRILLTLARAADNDADCGKLADAIQIPRLSPLRCRELLTRMTARLHRLQIGTIDSFFARLASSLALELGLPPGWRIVDDVESRRQRQEAIQSMLETGADNELIKLLRLLTKGTSQRTVSSLIEDTVENCHAIFLQTPVEAWHKVPTPPLPTKEHLHLTRLSLHELASQVGGKLTSAVSKDADLADRDQWEEMLKAGVLKKLVEGDATFNRKPLDAATLDVYQRVLSVISAYALNALAQQTAATRDLLDKFDSEHRVQRRRTGACSFDDIARALAGNQPNRRDSQTMLARQAFRFDARLSHLLLDEFQDTSQLQWKVLRPIVEQVVNKSKPSGPAKRKSQADSTELPPSFFCVGDVKQAIYGWRGGDARIFDTLKEQFGDLQPLPLDESYRSAQPIIDVVNQVFSRLTQHPDLGRSKAAAHSWGDHFPPHSTARRELLGHVRLQTVPQANKEEGEKQGEVTLRHVARHVADMYRETNDDSADAADRSAPTIGVLTRSNAAVGQLIFELQSLGIPASEEAGNPLTDSAAVRLILSLLQLADHPGDTIARCHVATSPLGESVGLTSIHDDPLAAHVSESLRRQLLVDGYGACVANWAKCLEPHGSRRDANRLRQLIRLADAFQSAATLRTRDFIRLATETKLTDPSGERVRVMNIHQSKGLQFDIVVLAELDEPLLGQEPPLVFGHDGGDTNAPPNAVCRYRNALIQLLLPDSLQRLFEQNVEQRTHESLCLLYVAMTRAIHCLEMFIAPTDKPPGKTFAGLLRATLVTDGIASPNQTLFEIGTAKWRGEPRAAKRRREVSAVGRSDEAKAKGSSRVRRTSSDKAAVFESRSVSEPSGIRFVPPLPAPARGLERRAPSDHDAARHRRLADSLKPIDRAALDRGSLIHKWFEQIEWLDSGSPTDVELLAAAKSLTPQCSDPTAMLPEFRAMLDHPTIATLMTRPRDRHPGCEPRVLREYPFAFRDQNHLVSGVIDRLILWQRDGRVDAAEVIDFKTDELGGADSVAAKVETYREQIAAYVAAVMRLFDVPRHKVSAQLAFVTAKQIVAITT